MRTWLAEMYVGLVAVKVWLKGKKTNIGAVVLVAVTFYLVGVGKLSPTTAYTVMLLALSYFAVTFRAAIAAHQAQWLALLTDALALGVAARSHNKAAAESALLNAAEQGITLVPSLPTVTTNKEPAQ